MRKENEGDILSHSFHRLAVEDTRLTLLHKGALFRETPQPSERSKICFYVSFKRPCRIRRSIPRSGKKVESRKKLARPHR